jgi:SPP1 gp7 family putative phage head morphogenesis protein
MTTVSSQKRKKASRPKAPTPRLLNAVRPNAGLTAWYQKRLDDQVAKMQDSLTYWLEAEYRATGLANGLAQDDSPAMAMRGSLRKLSRRWQWIFDKLADSLSKRIADRMLAHSDNALASGLKGEGLSVKFTMTRPMNDAYQAVIGEQVGLIKSIASEHLSEVEGLVMRSVQRGRDLGYLSRELQDRYGVTKRRAALIARDQNNKATSTLQAVRQRELGITEGVWKHSHAGKHPRPSHVAADGDTFELAKGMFIDDKWIMPGEEINCRCTWQAVVPGFDV